MFKKVFITGGSGHLGRELINYLKISNVEVYAPSHKACDITNLASLISHVDYFQPDLFIHAAAFVDTFGCENDIRKALDINVKGTMNVVEACMRRPIKVVYISSEYVFQGHPEYSNTIDDRLNPMNVYGKTKAAAEYIISILPNYKIIRAPFIKQTYPEVFCDQYCSRYFLEDVVPKIWFNILDKKNPENIIHIANEYKSLYQLYKSKGIGAKPIKMSKEQKKIIPQYTGLVNNSL